MKKVIFSAFENVFFLTKSGKTNTLAKVDTGAFSGVVHCTNIKCKDGLLSFNLLGDTKNYFKTTDFITRQVKNTHGGVKERFLVKFYIEIENRKFQILLGIDDRTKMEFNVLIGRAFLIKNNILVDPNLNLNLDDEWSKMGGKN